MNSKINVGLIGLGARGMALLSEVILKMDDVQVISICDLSNERLERAKQVFESYEKALPLTETDYMKVITNANVDAVIVSTSWTDHSEITIHAMEEGKYVACEVGGAFTIEECWKLVHTYEKTKTPCMLLENCCFGRDELMVLNMVHKGVLGEIVHCSGGYHHDLRHEIATGRASNHYRMDQYLFRNCENYPTHELGPIARVLDIHRGNRMVSLVSVSSKSKGLNEYIHRNLTDHPELAKLEFAQGDVITTVIKCARGETIVLTLDTTLPRYYSRGFTVRGTKGMFMEENESIFLDDTHNTFEENWKPQWGNADHYRDKYDHPIWKQYLEEGVKGGHDGMDWLVLSEFFNSVRNRTTPPIDVYDMVSWKCITALSEQSIQLGSQSVVIPDFTSGKWISKR